MNNQLTKEELETLLFISEERIKITNPLTENTLLNNLSLIQQKLLSQKLEVTN